MLVNKQYDIIVVNSVYSQTCSYRCMLSVNLWDGQYVSFAHRTLAKSPIHLWSRLVLATIKHDNSNFKLRQRSSKSGFSYSRLGPSLPMFPTQGHVHAVTVGAEEKQWENKNFTFWWSPLLILAFRRCSRWKCVTGLSQNWTTFDWNYDNNSFNYKVHYPGT